MNDNFIIWGSAGHSLVLYDVINGSGSKLLALFDNNSEAVSSIVGVPLHHGSDGFKQWMKYNPEFLNLSAAVAIGGSKGKIRQEISRLFKDYGIYVPPIINPTASISNTVKLPEGVHILANSVVAANVQIGKDCIINNGALVDHECELANGVHVAPGAVLCGCVFVGENSLIGAGAVVLPRVKIGRNSIVAAGAVVTKNVPPDTVVAGNPAVYLKKRGEDA